MGNITLIEPHGGVLKECNGSRDGRKVTVPDRVLAEALMIGNGSYSPLEGFLGHDAAWSVLEHLRLPSGIPWSIPPLLPLDRDLALTLGRGDVITLTGSREGALASVEVHEVFRFDAERAAALLFGTDDRAHPGVEAFLDLHDETLCVSGQIVMARDAGYDGIRNDLIMGPRHTRALFSRNEWYDVVAFQTRNPIHRAHEHLIRAALARSDAVLIHPIIGPTNSDDIPPHVRFLCYEALIDAYFDRRNLLVSALPAPMYYAGPREAVHHLIIRKNYGVRSLIVGRDHAGIGGFYHPYEAQELVNQVAPLIGMNVLSFPASFYCSRCSRTVFEPDCPHDGGSRIVFSGTTIRNALRSGTALPAEITRPEVARILSEWARSSEDA